jgi:hypothetical protein
MGEEEEKSACKRPRNKAQHEENIVSNQLFRLSTYGPFAEVEILHLVRHMEMALRRELLFSAKRNGIYTTLDTLFATPSESKRE